MNVEIHAMWQPRATRCPVKFVNCRKEKKVFFFHRKKNNRWECIRVAPSMPIHLSPSTLLWILSLHVLYSLFVSLGCSVFRQRTHSHPLSYKARDSILFFF